jgi:hypothetical protein
MPEGVELSFRAISAVDFVDSAPSNEATAPRGVHPPIGFTAHLASSGADRAMTLGWYTRSPDVDGVRVERRLLPAQGAPGPWIDVTAALSAAPAEMGAQDPDLSSWQDGARYAYRVTLAVGDVESAPVEATTPPAPPLAPSMTAGIQGPMVHVAWSYPGVAAVAWRVERTHVQGTMRFTTTLAEPGPGATSLDDPLPATGLYEYAVQARLPDGRWEYRDETSPKVSETLLVPDAGWAGALEASVVWMPGAEIAARDGAGHFALARGGSPGAVHSRADGGWATWAGLTGTLPPDALLFDAQGRLHVVYERPGDVSGWVVRHAALEGGTWTDESVTALSSYAHAWPTVAAAADGTLHLLWRDGYATWAPPTTWAVRRDGAWTAEALPAPWDVAFHATRLAVDEGGRPSFVLAGHLLRREGSVWTAEEIPGFPTWANGTDLSDLALFGLDRAVIGSAGSWSAYHVRERDASGWLPAEQALPVSSTPWRRMAASADGARLAVVENGPDARIAIRDAGEWRMLPLAPTYDPLVLGFTPAGKLWVLALAHMRLEDLDAPVPHVLYEEP